MVEIITYSLNNQQKTSDGYYRDVSSFTDQAIAHARQTSEDVLKRFQEHLRSHALEPVRTEPEYIFDLYTLGTLYRLYAGAADQLAEPSGKVLAWLYQIRQDHRPIKPAVDFIRGVFSGLLLKEKPQAHQYPPSYETFSSLLKWMEATGEFSEESRRLGLWSGFLAELDTDQQTSVIQQALVLADWFRSASEQALGKYTPNVEKFLEEKHPAYQWREDRFFCGRRREEYHLNMVGTEILNRAFRSNFLSAGKKVVLLPPCMKARQDGTCEAKSTPLGERCGHCTPTCRIHQITLLGDKHGFGVSIIPHELSVFSSGEIHPPQEDAIGIVGVSCPVTNVTGGWETKRLGIPAQGVLLDYCGCHWHWHKEGIPTDVNIQKLLQIIGA